jgi:hypothetical protein
VRDEKRTKEGQGKAHIEQKPRKSNKIEFEARPSAIDWSGSALTAEFDKLWLGFGFSTPRTRLLNNQEIPNKPTLYCPPLPQRTQTINTSRHRGHISQTSRKNLQEQL